jgi:UDP-2,4-diacetamido-2,4,6-trideoxy-beta-L-altropyranose hydrolase
MKNIAIRTDASHQIGIGHVMRCLTLANELRKQNNATVFFVTRKAEGNAEEKIKDAGFEYVELDTGVDAPISYLNHGNWLRAPQLSDAEEFKSALNRRGVFYVDLVIVDHYGIDYLWHKQIKNFTKKIFVIDDLGDRLHDCDYLLDQTYSCKADKYKNLVSSECNQYLGTLYALLRPEFEGLQPVKVDENSLLVMFGGTDPDNLTLKVLNVIENMSYLDKINVVLSGSAKNLVEVSTYCQSRDLISLHISPNNIAKLMAESKLAIGAAGTTSWERCVAGLPTVAVIQAFNQREIASSLQKAGVISYIEANNIDDQLKDKVSEWLIALSKDNDYMEKCLDVCDGYGTNRVVSGILND